MEYFFLYHFPQSSSSADTEVRIVAFYIYNPAFRSKVFDLLHESILRLQALLLFGIRTIAACLIYTRDVRAI